MKKKSAVKAKPARGGQTDISPTMHDPRTQAAFASAGTKASPGSLATCACAAAHSFARGVEADHTSTSVGFTYTPCFTR